MAIYRRQTQTLYVRWGDWLTPWVTVLAVGGTIASARMLPTQPPDRDRV
jgi:apolipoprotein N-acyltransferase